MPCDRLANPPKRVVEILRQLEKKKTSRVAFELAFLFKYLVGAAESRDVARFVKQMMETKVLQGLHALLRFGEPIIAKGALPPLIRSATQAGIDGKQVEVNELLPAALARQPINVPQMRCPVAGGTLFRWWLAR